MFSHAFLSTALLAALSFEGVNASLCKPRPSSSSSTIVVSPTSSSASISTEISSSASEPYTTTSTSISSEISSSASEPYTTTSASISSEISSSTSEPYTTTSSSISTEISSSTSETYITTSTVVSSATSSAAPTCTANTDNVIVNPSFDDTTEVDGSVSYTGSPWTLSDSSAEIRLQDDTEKAHSGSAFAFVSVTLRDTVTSISQQLSGLDSEKQYMLTYFWALTNQQSIYDGRCYIDIIMDGQTYDKATIGRTTAYQYQQQNVVLTPPSANPLLQLSLHCDGSYFYGADFMLDDITMHTFCPPCTLLDPSPETSTCGVQGYTNDYVDQIGAGESSSLENCAESCAETGNCLSFAYSQSGASKSCTLYSAPVDTIAVIPYTGSSSRFYDSSCFQCGVTTVNRA